jgi:membrane protease YdiL (CAAX protease family)
MISMQNSIEFINSMEVGLVFAYFALAYMVYFFAYKNKRLEDLANRFTKDPASNITFINCVRSLGFIFLGLIPGIIFPILFNTTFPEMGIQFPKGRHVWLWFLVPIVLSFLGSFFRSTKGMDLDFYPQVRIRSWSRSALVINTVFWITYLIGYEFAFRGYLFFPAVRDFGLWPAILINSSVYAITHISKGSAEAFGSFFLGILFCLIAYHTNSFLIPLILHIILAIGNDIKAIQANPSMHIVEQVKE